MNTRIIRERCIAYVRVHPVTIVVVTVLLFAGNRVDGNRVNILRVS